MSDPLIDEARRAAREFNRPEVRRQASAMARQLAGVSADAPQHELELREAIRCLMMALPLSPTGTHGLTAAAISHSARALSLSLRIRGVNVEVEPETPVTPEPAAADRGTGARPPVAIDADRGTGAAPAEERLPYYIDKD